MRSQDLERGICRVYRKTGYSQYCQKESCSRASEGGEGKLLYYLKYDEGRFDTLLKIMMRMKDIDTDRLQLNKTASGKGNGTKHPNCVARPYVDTLVFKPIKEGQMMQSAPPSLSYSKSFHPEHHDLLYKLLKCEQKLIRSTLEVSGFHHTEGHDWNVLWMNSSGKPYIYEGLNEYQRVNHFPSSFEMTRKDKLATNVLKM